MQNVDIRQSLKLKQKNQLCCRIRQRQLSLWCRKLKSISPCILTRRLLVDVGIIMVCFFIYNISPNSILIKKFLFTYSSRTYLQDPNISEQSLTQIPAVLMRLRSINVCTNTYLVSIRPSDKDLRFTWGPFNHQFGPSMYIYQGWVEPRLDRSLARKPRVLRSLRSARSTQAFRKLALPLRYIIFLARIIAKLKAYDFFKISLKMLLYTISRTFLTSKIGK